MGTNGLRSLFTFSYETFHMELSFLIVLLFAVILKRLPSYSYCNMKERNVIDLKLNVNKSLNGPRLSLIKDARRQIKKDWPLSDKGIN